MRGVKGAGLLQERMRRTSKVRRVWGGRGCRRRAFKRGFVPTHGAMRTRRLSGAGEHASQALGRGSRARRCAEARLGTRGDIQPASGVAGAAAERVALRQARQAHRRIASSPASPRRTRPTPAEPPPPAGPRKPVSGRRALALGLQSPAGGRARAAHSLRTSRRAPASGRSSARRKTRLAAACAPPGCTRKPPPPPPSAGACRDPAGRPLRAEAGRFF